ncbi:MAG: SLC13 family permease [Acetobacterales bacterium]
MTIDQSLLFALIAAVLGLLVWGRWRYDLVAFAALMAALLLGLVPTEEAFSGFGHPATVIIAMVLIVSRGLSNSGVVEFIASRVASEQRSLSGHIGLMSGVSAALSAVMNNVAALALLMPVDMQAAAKAKRSPALSLMPLAFASILGGLITLIGTPPNIVVSAFRRDAMGEPFAMFDFAPVGLACAVAGVLFIALVGWRLIPGERTRNPGKELRQLDDYVSELRVPDDGKAAGRRLDSFDTEAEEAEVQILGLVRQGKRLPGLARGRTVAAGDSLVVEGGPEAIEKFAGALDLDYRESEAPEDSLKGEDLEIREAVVPDGSLAQGRSIGSLRLLRRYGVTLLGVSRQGRPVRDRLRHLVIEAGDVLLLLGPSDRIGEAMARLGGLPLASRGVTVLQRQKALPAVALFAAAVIAASFGLLSLDLALGCVVTLYVVLGIVPIRETYESIDWSVIVLLGALIPIGVAMETTGGTRLLAEWLLWMSWGQPAAVVLAALMVLVMALSAVLNNTATALITAPVAVDVARQLEVNADPFLMAVAVAASCAFLTPIGHKNNVLIMGPGGYRFGDYWRMGLPLEIIVLAVGVPAILLFWPL